MQNSDWSWWMFLSVCVIFTAGTLDLLDAITNYIMLSTAGGECYE